METKKTRKSESVSGYAPVNGLNMYYEIHGQGRPLVLIHGGGSTIQTTFGIILPMLAESHKVIAPELQAHGHTKDRDTPESFIQDAADVAALLNYLGIDKADIFGFSNGGHTALQLGIDHSEIINKLVIASAFYKRSGAVPGLFEGLQNASLANMPELLKEGYLSINNDSAGLQRMFDQDRTRMLGFTDWSDEDLASIKAPCLIIAGDKDVVTPEHATEMSRKIPNAELLILPGNHGSYIGEIMSRQQTSRIPAFTVAFIEEFLEQHPQK
jgi:pimeloyl-ACP methyl ester carboxylesterase